LLGAALSFGGRDVTKNLILQKLKELKDQIPFLKERRVTYKDTPEFKSWETSLKKWLLQGGADTHREYEAIEHLDYQMLRMGHPGYDRLDEQQYQSNLDDVLVALTSGIENLEMGLPAIPERKNGSIRKHGDVTINAQNVAFGDNSNVTITNNITLANILEILEKEIESKVNEPEEKRRLLGGLRDFMKHPLTTAITAQGIAALLKAYTG
jgi:hypothetical protein